MKTVISASRRTDLPCCYMDETKQAFLDGEITLINQFNNKPYTISLKKGDIHCIVWWSKDFKNFISDIEFWKQYNNFFQFTINGYTDESKARFLECGIKTSLSGRIEQVSTLASIFTPEAISWRFDPIVFWKEGDVIMSNIDDFNYISSEMGKIGIKRCVISFATWYENSIKKARNRHPKHEFIFIEPDLGHKKEIIKFISPVNKDNGITTYSCANADIVDDDLVFGSSCVDGELLGKLFGEPASLAKDTTQREACGCTKSRDIGSYKQKCKNNCIYCYAN